MRILWKGSKTKGPKMTRSEDIIIEEEEKPVSSPGGRLKEKPISSPGGRLKEKPISMPGGKWKTAQKLAVRKPDTVFANVTKAAVRHKLQGELRGMLFKSKKVNVGWFYSIIILTVNVIFLFIGACVFIYIEARAEKKEWEQDWKKKQHFAVHIKKSEQILPKLLLLQQEMCRKSNPRATNENNDWKFSGSLHYCITILSTIGYGVVYPHTKISKVITVAYALFGIPIYAVYLSYAYLFISSILTAVSDWTLKRIRGRYTDLHQILFKSLLANIILWTYLAILILLWTPPTKDNTLLDELYFQVIRFTSIGFGDEFREISEVPEHVPILMNIFCVAFVVLPFGISLTSYYFQIFRKLCGNRSKKIQKKYAQLRIPVSVKEKMRSKTQALVSFRRLDTETGNGNPSNSFNNTKSTVLTCSVSSSANS